MRQDEYCSEVADGLCDEDGNVICANAAWIAMAIAAYLRANNLVIAEHKEREEQGE